MTKEYAVIIERGDRSFGAWVPDLPGCVAAGKSAAAVERLNREAIPCHIEGLKATGEPVPEPTSRVTSVAVA